MRKLKICSPILVVLLAALMLLPASALAEEDAAFFDTTPFTGKKIGVQTGTTCASMVDQFVTDPEKVYFTTTPDIATALKSGKIDAFIGDEPNVRYLAAQSEGIKVEILESTLDLIADIFPKTDKGKKLCDEMNAYILKLKENGELEKLEKKWFEGNEVDWTSNDYENYPDTNGVLVVATDPTYAPMEYLVDGEIVGYEIDLVAGFCLEYGYRPQFVSCEFSSVIVGVSSGKFDMGTSGLTITEERKESVYFSEPIYESYMAIAFLNGESENSFSIVKSFEKVFITENRWKNFLSGALVTINITVSSILIGTVLGFAWYMLYRGGNKVTVAVSKAVLWVIGGMPTVVFLMVLFYIVFGKSNASGTVISIIGFSFIFAGFVMSTLKNGEMTVDRGQYLAAEALGYGKTKAFFRIIFPQAVKYVWPIYISEISTHIKATSVVGYITVVDITKVGDIIRGATYDAFFPLISITILYFIMSAILQRIAILIQKMTDPFRRSQKKILGGAVIK